MLCFGGRSSLSWTRKGMAEVIALPAFLCPMLLGRSSNLIPRQKRPPLSRARNIASSSYSVPLPREQQGPLQDGASLRLSEKQQIDLGRLIEQHTARRDNVIKGKQKESDDLVSLAITHEVVNDILKRPKAFSSKAESVYLLHDAKLSLEKYQDAEDDRIQDQVQIIAPKLAFAYLNIHRPNDAITIAEIATRRWTEEQEEKRRDSWKAAVSLAYSMDLYSIAVQMTAMLSKHSSLSGNWMNLAQLQSLLQLAERGERNSLIHKAENIWVFYEKKGLKAPESDMIIVLDSQVRRGDIAKVSQTLEAMKRHDIKISADAWRNILWPSLRGRDKNEILKLVVDTSSDGAASIAEILLAHYGEQSNVRGCLRVLKVFGIQSGYKVMPSFMVKPTLRMYHEMIKILSRKYKPDYAMRYLNLAITEECKGDYTSSYLEISIALTKVRRAEEAIELGFQLMKSPLQGQLPWRAFDTAHNSTKMLTPSRRVYRSLLFGSCFLSDTLAIVPTARLILLDMFSYKKQISERILKPLAKIVSRLGLNASLPRLIELTEAIFAKSEIDFSTEEDLKRWEKMTAKFEEEGVLDLLTIRAWNRMRIEPKGIEAVKVKAVARALFNIPFYGPRKEVTIKSFGDALKESMVRVAITELPLDATLSPAGFAMRLRVFAVIRRDVESALIIYQAMTAAGIQPSMHHIAPLIEGLVLVKRLKDAREIKNRAVQEFPKTSIPTRIYSALVRGYGQLEDWRGLMDVAFEMKKDGVRTDQSFKAAFMTAKRKLKQQQDDLTKEDQERMEKVRLLIKRSKFIPPFNEPISVYSTTLLFQEFHRNGKFLDAHQYLAMTLDRGLETDRSLRMELMRSENWIRKQMNLQNAHRNPRRLDYLSKVLKLCLLNREKARGSKEEAKSFIELLRKEDSARKDLIFLLQDALGTSRLWEEAQTIKNN